MEALVNVYYRVHSALRSWLKPLDGLAPLALRWYLVPVFWVAGTKKLAGIDNIIAWFGNTEWGLGLPFPTVMAYLAAYTEVIGAILLALGLATRVIALPLMIAMVVAALTVHWGNGWAAIADSGAQEVAVRLGAVRQLLQEHGSYSWLTEKGPLVILNNGVEFAVTYFVMLLALVCTGGGRYVSLDYYLTRFTQRWR